ncbi:MAG: hypothetical protein LBM27_01685, partial [Lactobacillaceae bacterium]|nr:hypothetical protein [Lactobacillaceae bacterium]
MRIKLFKSGKLWVTTAAIGVVTAMGNEIAKADTFDLSNQINAPKVDANTNQVNKQVISATLGINSDGNDVAQESSANDYVVLQTRPTQNETSAKTFENNSTPAAQTDSQNDGNVDSSESVDTNSLLPINYQTNDIQTPTSTSIDTYSLKLFLGTNTQYDTDIREVAKTFDPNFFTDVQDLLKKVDENQISQSNYNDQFSALNVRYVALRSEILNQYNAILQSRLKTIQTFQDSDKHDYKVYNSDQAWQTHTILSDKAAAYKQKLIDMGYSTQSEITTGTNNMREVISAINDFNDFFVNVVTFTDNSKSYSVENTRVGDNVVLIGFKGDTFTVNNPLSSHTTQIRPISSTTNVTNDQDANRTSNLSQAPDYFSNLDVNMGIANFRSPSNQFWYELGNDAYSSTNSLTTLNRYWTGHNSVQVKYGNYASALTNVKAEVLRKDNLIHISGTTANAKDAGNKLQIFDVTTGKEVPGDFVVGQNGIINVKLDSDSGVSLGDDLKLIQTSMVYPSQSIVSISDTTTKVVMESADTTPDYSQVADNVRNNMIGSSTDTQAQASGLIDVVFVDVSTALKAQGYTVNQGLSMSSDQLNQLIPEKVDPINGYGIVTYNLRYGTDSLFGGTYNDRIVDYPSYQVVAVATANMKTDPTWTVDDVVQRNSTTGIYEPVSNWQAVLQHTSMTGVPNGYQVVKATTSPVVTKNVGRDYLQYVVYLLPKDGEQHPIQTLPAEIYATYTSTSKDGIKTVEDVKNPAWTASGSSIASSSDWGYSIGGIRPGATIQVKATTRYLSGVTINIPAFSITAPTQVELEHFLDAHPSFDIQPTKEDIQEYLSLFKMTPHEATLSTSVTSQTYQSAVMNEPGVMDAVHAFYDGVNNQTLTFSQIYDASKTLDTVVGQANADRQAATIPIQNLYNQVTYASSSTYVSPALKDSITSLYKL